MPNWCNNIVTFKHRDHKQIAKVVRGYNAGGLMSKFFPCPKELKETTAGFKGAGTPEQAELEAKQKTNKVLFGYTDWYDWQCNEWGTKWDVGRREYHDKVSIKRGSTEVTLDFDSAWSPPIAFYEKMHDQQSFSIKALYYEPGVGVIGKWEDGDEDAHDLDACPRGIKGAKWLKENIPAYLVETFNVMADVLPDEE
jgi:hypothetical protein